MEEEKKCKFCEGTGFVTEGDGPDDFITVECEECEPEPMEAGVSNEDR